MKSVQDALRAIDGTMEALVRHYTLLKLVMSVAQRPPNDPHPAIAKLRKDLAWRGPNGSKAGHVCLPREMADQLLEWIDVNKSRL